MFNYLKLYITGLNPSEIKLELLNFRIDFNFEESDEKKFIDKVCQKLDYFICLIIIFFSKSIL